MIRYTLRLAILLCCIFLATAIFVGLHMPGEEIGAGTAVSGDMDTAQRLAAEEQALQALRLELSRQLRAYYLGQAGEEETARLIAETEALRQRVEKLEALLARENE